MGVFHHLQGKIRVLKVVIRRLTTVIIFDGNLVVVVETLMFFTWKEQLATMESFFGVF